MVDDVAREFADKGLIVLAVDVLEPDQKVKKYLTDHPRSVPIVLTKDTNLAATYNAQSYPIYVVIDRDGNTAAEQRGAAGEAALGGPGRTGIEVGVGGLKINATTNLAAKCSPMAIWRKYGKTEWCSS
jgi:hypothetical protein